MGADANAADDDRLGEGIARRLHAREGTAAALDLRFDGAGAGWAKCSLLVRDDMLNGHGLCHGGIIFTLADTAFAWACNSRNVKTLAQSATIAFLAPARPGERLSAEAREAAAAGRTGVYEAVVTGEDGRIIAVFHGLSRSVGGAAVAD